jgi:nitrate reductase NapAB chaperone NapD
MVIAGVVIDLKQADRGTTLRLLSTMDGVREVRESEVPGKLAAVLEAANEHIVTDLCSALLKVPGIVGVNPACIYYDVQEELPA